MTKTLLPYVGFDRSEFVETLREIGVVVTNRRKLDFNKLRRKYRRDMAELQELTKRKASRVDG